MLLSTAGRLPPRPSLTPAATPRPSSTSCWQGRESALQTGERAARRRRLRAAGRHRAAGLYGVPGRSFAVLQLLQLPGADAAAVDRGGELPAPVLGPALLRIAWEYGLLRGIRRAAGGGAGTRAGAAAEHRRAGPLHLPDLL